MLARGGLVCVSKKDGDMPEFTPFIESPTLYAELRKQ